MLAPDPLGQGSAAIGMLSARVADAVHRPVCADFQDPASPGRSCLVSCCGVVGPAKARMQPLWPCQGTGYGRSLHKVPADRSALIEGRDADALTMVLHHSCC